jgi:hypothetical protein
MTVRASADRRPDAHCHRPVAGRGERRRDDRERGRGDQRGTESLHGTRRDQHGVVAGESGDQGRDGEGGEARDEQTPPAVDVAEPTAGQQQAREHQDVAADHPLQCGRAQVQVALDGRDRDVDDVVVEVGHEGRQRHRHQHPHAPGYCVHA